MLTDGLSNPHPPSVTPVCLFRVTNDLLLVMNWELIAMVLKRRRENIAKLNISYFRSRNVSPLFRCNSSVSNVTSSQMSEKENTTDPILQIYRITELLGFLNFQENTTNLIVKNLFCFVLFLHFMTQHKELLAKRYQLNKVGTFYPNRRIKTLIQSWPENIS